MRIFRIGQIISFWLTLAGIPIFCSASDPADESKSAPALKTLLNEGIVRRASLSQISQTVKEAQRAQPGDPVLEYAHGLVLLSRVQPAKAVECFDAALKCRPTYLPAWQALLRTRLVRKETKLLETDSLRLAQLVGNEETFWPNPSKRETAAVWLGEVAGFLSLPDVDLMDPEKRQQFESAIHQELGEAFTVAFAAGKKALLEDYQALQRELKKEIGQESESQETKAEDELAELTDQSEALEQKTETLKMSADQWKTWLNERVDKTDAELKTLEKDYQALEQAAQGVSRLIQQTQVDAGRYSTELALQGIRGRDADQQPAMLQLRQELTKYQVQYQELEQRAARVLLQARRILVERSLAVKKYQQATGKIVQETETLTRWKKNVEKASEKIENRDPQTVGRSLKKRLSMPASYFELDEKAELAKLIDFAGGTLDTP